MHNFDWAAPARAQRTEGKAGLPCWLCRGGPVEVSLQEQGRNLGFEPVGTSVSRQLKRLKPNWEVTSLSIDRMLSRGLQVQSGKIRSGFRCKLS